MDLERIKRIRQALTLHFAVIACLTAMLVASGSGSMFLPTLMLLVSVSAYVFVDKLEWFKLGRAGSYIGMTIATVIALVSFFFSVAKDSEPGQLMSVAGLLIYPECVLFFQAKNLRVYEQLAIFLLLEMIVAALINDSILFGILLTPILLLWVSSLFLFSRYSTLVQISPNIEQPVPLLYEILYGYFVKSVMRPVSPARTVVATPITDAAVLASRSRRRILLTLPIGLGAIVFAGTFFYLLPRTEASRLGAIGVRNQVGLPDELSVGTVGRLLQNNTPVMRVKLTSVKDGKVYRVLPSEPPYLRANVFDEYLAPRGLYQQGKWVNYGQPQFGRYAFPDFSRANNRDQVSVEIDIRKQFATTMFLIPPLQERPLNQGVSLRYNPYAMIFEKPDSVSNFPKSVAYRFNTAGFQNGRQLRVAPALRVELGRHLRIHRMPSLDAYRLNLLDRLAIPMNDSYAVASGLERYMSQSGEFSYTLDLGPKIDSDLDPIEDFVINQKAGHCQNYASALTVMLRQSGIPARIVVGYRPTQFNKYGSYFAVRQSDAHAWIEAAFSYDQLVGTELEPWIDNAFSMYWVRFDATPSASGSDLEIVEQSGQTMDYAEKLWEDYVVEGDKIDQGSLYQTVSGANQNVYEEFLARLNQLKAGFSGGLFTSDIGFAWPLAIGIFLVGVVIVGVWQFLVLLPRLAPNLALRLGVGRKRRDPIQQPFFARCVSLLEGVGIQRADGQTMNELTEQAAIVLSANNSAAGATAESLAYLTKLYYRLRFGTSSEMDSAERAGVEQRLSALERTVRDFKPGKQ